MAIGMRFTSGEAGSMALGQMGQLFESGTTVISGKKIVAIQFVDDSTFTTLTPETSDFIGNTGGSGDSVTTDTFPAGMTIYGQWTAFTLATGAVIAYLGSF